MAKGKRIEQRESRGRVITNTTGNPEGTRPNFDVIVNSPANGQHRPSFMNVEVQNENGSFISFQFDGRQTRTLYEVLFRHFERVDY